MVADGINGVDLSVVIKDMGRRYSRSDLAVSASKLLLNDFFGGWTEEDQSILQRYAFSDGLFPAHGELIDFIGVKTDLRNHAWISVPPNGGIHHGDIPIPDDQVHAEAIEYIALFMALERAQRQNPASFNCLELGSSYGPWLVAAGVLAKRMGFSSIDLTGVEATPSGVARMTEHASRNGLTEDSSIILRPLHAAVYHEDAPVYFPKVDVSYDNGAQISERVSEKDYRGVELEYETVDGLSLKSLTAHLDRVDYLHMDLQGTEKSLLENDEFVQVLNDKVAVLFIATQSRLIEGIALDTFSRNNWIIKRERPTIFAQNDRTSDVNGWTLRDGGQLWFNSKFNV